MDCSFFLRMCNLSIPINFLCFQDIENGKVRLLSNLGNSQCQFDTRDTDKLMVLALLVVTIRSVLPFINI